MHDAMAYRCRHFSAEMRLYPVDQVIEEELRAGFVLARPALLGEQRAVRGFRDEVRR